MNPLRGADTGGARPARSETTPLSFQTPGDGEQIADGIVGICRDIPLPVDDFGEPAEIVVDVLRLVGNSHGRREDAEHQHTGNNRQQF